MNDKGLHILQKNVERLPCTQNYVSGQPMQALNWQEAPQKPRRRRKPGPHPAATNNTLSGFPHQKLLLGNMVGRALLKSQISSIGEEAIRTSKSIKKRMPGNYGRSKDTASFSRLYESDTEVQTFPIDLSVFSDSLPISQVKPLTFQSVRRKSTLPKFKTTRGRGGKQHGKPRFKITSGTPKKKKISEKKFPLSSINKAKKTAIFSRSGPFPDGSGSAFLRHLDFRPIHLDEEKLARTLSLAAAGACAAPALSSVNYESWMVSNVSASSSFTSTAEMDLSSVELDACDSRDNTGHALAESQALIEGTQSERIKQDLFPPATDGHIDSISVGSPCFQTSGNVKARSVSKQDAASVCSDCKVFESKACQISPKNVVSLKATPSQGAEETTQAADSSREDELADRELRQMMDGCTSDNTALSTGDEGGEGGGARGKKGKVRTRSATPHNSHTLKMNSVSSSGCCSNECTTNLASSSQASSASASGTQSQAFIGLDEKSRERVQQEFDLRLGKYISMLCGDNADSSAFRRLQARILRQRQRASLSQVWSELASKIAKKSCPNTADRKPDGKTASFTAATNLARQDTSPAKGNGQRNTSSNKKEELSPNAYEGLPPTSRRPHSTDLSNPTRRYPTPSLRYLLKHAVNCHAAKNAEINSPKLPSRTINGACKPGNQVGDNTMANPGCQRNNKQGVHAKPPTWKDSKQTTAQTDNTCYCISNLASTVSQAVNESYHMPSSPPFLVNLTSFSDVNSPAHYANRKIPQAWADKSSNRGSPTTPRRKNSPKNSYPSTGRHSSLENLSDGSKNYPTRTSPSENMRRTTSHKGGTRSPQSMTWLPPSPQNFKGGDFIKDVSSRVEADLQKYNAVMNRCRALLGETEPAQQDSSTWSHCSNVASVNAEPAKGRENLGSEPTTAIGTQEHPASVEKAGARRTSADGNLVEGATGFQERCLVDKGLPLLTKPTRVSRAFAVKPERSSSLQSAHEEANKPDLFQLKRCSSNPYYMGVVDFGSVEAIKRLVDPTNCQGKPKVTFDVESDRSVVSTVSSYNSPRRIDEMTCTQCPALATQQLHGHRTKKVNPNKKKKLLSKSSGKSSRQLSLPANSAAKASGKTNNKALIKPMQFHQPMTAKESCTSRLPVRMNPYYRPTLELKKKRTKRSQAQPRPGSQTSWKTEDTEGPARTPTLDLLGKPVKKKKKRLRKALEVLSDLTEESARTISKLTTKKKKKKNCLKNDIEASQWDNLEESGHSLCGTSETDPETCVQAEDNLGAIGPPITEDVSETCALHELVGFPSRMESASTVPKTETLQALKTKGPCFAIRDLVEKNPEPVEKSFCSSGGEKSSEIALSLKKHGVSFRSYPKAIHKQQRSASSGTIKAPTLTFSLAKNLGAASGLKAVSSAVGSARSPAKTTSLKKCGYRPVFREAEEEPKPPEATGDAEVSPSNEELEKCRRAFAAYKDEHHALEDEAAARVEASQEITKTAVLRKAGPLVMALLIQWLVQYNYAN